MNDDFFKVVLLAGAGFLLYRYMQNQNTVNNTSTNTSNERYFKLPNGGVVAESQLLSLGYINIQGSWYLKTDVDIAYRQMLATNVSNSVSNLIKILKDNFNQDALIFNGSDVSQDSPFSGGGNLDYGNVAGIKKQKFSLFRIVNK